MRYFERISVFDQIFDTRNHKRKPEVDRDLVDGGREIALMSRRSLVAISLHSCLFDISILWKSHIDPVLFLNIDI